MIEQNSVRECPNYLMALLITAPQNMTCVQRKMEISAVCKFRFIFSGNHDTMTIGRYCCVV